MKSLMHSCRLIFSLTVAYLVLFTCMQVIENIGISETLLIDRHEILLRKHLMSKRMETVDQHKRILGLKSQHSRSDQMKTEAQQTPLLLCPEPSIPGKFEVTIPVIFYVYHMYDNDIVFNLCITAFVP